MQHLHTIRTVLSGLLLIGAFPVFAQSTTLDALPQTAQDEIARVCLPVQFREGASAYRTCVQAEVDLRSSGSANEMARLSFDDKYAVQQACAKAGGQSSDAYQTCVDDQISQLNRISAPDFTNVAEDELYVVQQTCFDAQSTQGAASYRACLNAEVESLLALPAADTSQLNMLDKNALQLRCSANASTATKYRECIAVEFESIAGTEPSFLPVSTATAIVRNNTTKPTPRVSVVNESVTKLAEQNLAAVVSEEPAVQSEAEQTRAIMALPRNITPPANDSADTAELTTAQVDSSALETNSQNTLRDATSNTLETETTNTTAATRTNVEPRVISRPDLVKALEVQNRDEKPVSSVESTRTANAATETTIDTTDTTAASTTGKTIKPADVWQLFLDKLASLNSMGWLIIAGILALPALLLGLFSLVRRIKQPADEIEPIHNSALTDRIEPGIKTRMARHEKEAAELFGEPMSAGAGADAPQPQPQPQPTSSPLAEPAQSTAAGNAPGFSQHDAVTRIAKKGEQPFQETVRLSPGHAWQSAFGLWLQDKPESDQLALCIEFLIYWVAYGDERYNPELKKRLFTASNLSHQDQIKRWVLKEDVFAFSDVIGWMRNHATQQQQEQSLSLIMALLISENSVTPTQNTLLRFLSDAFNMGASELEARFEQAFGHTLPPMPRPDKQAWWQKQSAASIALWDSRTLATRPELDQMRARLGVSANANDTQITSAFRRASRRCHPDRFTALGDREHTLAEQRFAKFEEARDKLLGVIV